VAYSTTTFRQRNTRFPDSAQAWDITGSVFTLRDGAAAHAAYRAERGDNEAAPAPHTGRRHQAAAVDAVESTLPNTSVAFRISSIVPIEIRAWV
jgi:hypothetical protein